MYQLLKMTENIASRLARVGVRAELYCRVRSHLSRCNRCALVCPTGGISWPEGVMCIGKCLDCGLCAAVCPTGALYLQEPGEEMLIRQLQYLAGEYGNAVVTCAHTEHGGKLPRKVVLSCLGSLSVECLTMVLAKKLPVEFYLLTEKCATCLVTGGGDLFLIRLAEAQSCSGLEGAPVRIVNEIKPAAGRGISRTKRKEQYTGRRDFFRETWHGLQQMVAGLINDVLDGEEDGGKDKATGKSSFRVKQVNPRRDLFLEAMNRVGGLSWPYPRPNVTGTCFFCGVCSILCPTGSLDQSDDGGVLSLRLNASTCAGCGLCADVCLYRSITIEKACGNLPTGQRPAIARGWKQVCPECGTEFAASKETLKCHGCIGKEKWK